VAIKRVKNVFDDEVDCRRILREVTLMRKLNHPSVVRIIEILEPEDPRSIEQLYIVMEYMQSDLKKLIRSSLFLEPYHIQKIMYNILIGVKYLHDSQVLHRDLKPANVLINEDCSIKICDFGLARSIWTKEATSSDEEESKEEGCAALRLPKIATKVCPTPVENDYGIVAQTANPAVPLIRVIKT
jgi:mitogen-activated protein kinase 1/3